MATKDGDKPEEVEDAEILGEEDPDTPVDSLLADDEEDEDPSEKGNLFVAEDEEHAAEPGGLPDPIKVEALDDLSDTGNDGDENPVEDAPLPETSENTGETDVASEADEDVEVPADEDNSAVEEQVEALSESSETEEETDKGLEDDGALDAEPADEASEVSAEEPADSDDKLPEDDASPPEEDPVVDAALPPEEDPVEAVKPEAGIADEKLPEPMVIDREAQEKASEPETEAPKLSETAATLLATAASSPGAGIAHEPEVDHEEEEYFEEEEEEELHQSSFLRKLGVGAGLLIAGALVALWLGPKIAPGLPSGMGGVRDWLMPGQSEAQAQIETLRTDLERRIAVLPRQRSEAEIAAIVAGSVAANRTDYEARIASLEARVEELIDIGSRADASGFEQRIATLENRVGGVAAQITSLNNTLTSFESDGSVSETAIAQMAGFTANVEAVRAEVAGLVDLTASLEQEMSEVRSSAERRVQDAESEIASAQEQAAKAETAANIDAGLNAIKAALVSGGPFVDAIAQLEPHAEIPLTLTLASEEGVATVVELQDGFTDAAHKAIRASIQADAEDSVVGRMGAFLSAQVANRSLTPQEGDTTDAILSRAEAAVRLGDMKTAAGEISSLSPEASNGMADWADMLVQRVDVEVDFEQLIDQLQTTN